MNLKNICLLALVSASVTAVNLVNTPEANAQSYRSRRSVPASNTVTGNVGSNINSGPVGASVVTDGTANGTASSPTNASTNAKVNFFKEPGGVSTPPIQVRTIGTKANQTSTAGGVTGSGSSESKVDAKVGSVTFGTNAQGSVRGATSGLIQTNSAASLNTGTGVGSSSGGVNFSGSR